jgi:transcriptional regulator with XRE-family HTH domain
MAPARIRRLRSSLGLSQAALASRLGVSSNTVARWERGVTKPTAENVARLRALEEAPVPVAAPWPEVVPAQRAFSKEELVRLLRAAVKRVPGLPYAVGGADALAAAGYERETKDVDVFVAHEHLGALMGALRAVGLKTYTVQSPSHYGAHLAGDLDRDRRIDVLVPFGEPELTAIEEAREDARGLRVMGPDHLAATKATAWFYSGDGKHMQDVAELIRRGVASETRIRAILRSIDREDVARFDEGLALFMGGARIKPPRRRS